MNLPALEGIKLYNKAVEKQNDKRLWDLFLRESHEKAISFDDWKKQREKKYIDYKKSKHDELNKINKKVVVNQNPIDSLSNKSKIEKMIEKDRKFRLKGGL